MKKKIYQKPKLSMLAGAISVGLLAMGYVAQANAITSIPFNPLNHMLVILSQLMVAGAGLMTLRYIMILFLMPRGDSTAGITSLLIGNYPIFRI